MSNHLFKIAGKIVDQYDDPNFVDSVEAKLRFGVELTAPEDLHKLGDHNFAIKFRGNAGDYRRYPIHTKLATVFSSHYFEEHQNQLPLQMAKEAFDNINVAREGFDLVQLDWDREEQVKTAGYGIQAEELGSFTQNQAASRLPNMSPEDRVRTAYEISKVASITNRQVWDYVPKDELGTSFSVALQERRELLKTAAEFKLNMFENMVADWKGKSAFDVACALCEFDKFAGFRDRYKHGFTDPFYAAFSGFPLAADQEKIAAIQSFYPIADSEGNVLTKEAANSMTTEQHVHALMANFPKEGAAYLVEQEKTRGQDWGVSYHEARDIYFS